MHLVVASFRSLIPLRLPILEEHPVLMSEHANASPEARKQTTQIMFETFNSPAFLLTMQNVLSVYDYGRLTALAVTAGHQAIDIVPVYEGSFARPCSAFNRVLQVILFLGPDNNCALGERI